MDLLGGYGSDGSSSSSPGDDAAAAPAPPSAAAPPPASLTSPPEPVMESSRRTRGKRLVSLHAVLPTHIMDQLTQASAGATGLLDSDDEEPEAARQPPKKKSTSVVGKDEGLSSLLSELKSAPTTNTFLHSGDKKPAAPSQPLGQAFMTTTETVAVTEKDKDSVVDIHEKQPESASQRPEPETKADTKPKAAASPTAIRPAAAPRPSSSVSVPRPSGMSRPVVSAPLTAAATTSTQAQQSHPQQQQVGSYHEPEQTIDPRLAKKRSRKEMEKALREGNMSAIEGITTLEAEAAVYVPQEETYRVPTHGITKVAPVSMYDPKAGTDVVQANVTGKQRGKHQINQLLASAANLELQRARAMGTGTVKSKRADAKRKYGW